MGFGFTLWETKAFLEGRIILEKLKNKGTSFQTIQGCAMANGAGDLQKANQFGAKYYRFTIKQALQLSASDQLSGPYILLAGGSSGDGDFQNLADSIQDAWNRVVIKPSLILCSNEQNEISYQLARNVRSVLSLPVPIAKGPYTSVVENAGKNKYYDVFRGKLSLDDSNIPEVFNYYQKPAWRKDPGTKFENFRRRSIFAYIVSELKKKGVQKFVITEAHDGSTTRDGYPQQGDYVYASREGWNTIVEICNLLGVEVVCYYMAPFIGQPGNTMV
jgi:hypothetical protein